MLFRLFTRVVKLQQNVMDVNSRLVHDSKNREMMEQQQNERSAVLCYTAGSSARMLGRREEVERLGRSSLLS